MLPISGSSTSYSRRSRAASNIDVQKWVARRHGFVPETAWIEHCKTLCGISIAGLAGEPCPPRVQPILREAFHALHLLR